MLRRCNLSKRVLMLVAALTGFACAGPSGAGAMDTNEVIERWGSSLGGREKLEAVKTLHVRTSLKIFGLDGTGEEWSTSDGRHHQTADVGGLFHVETVYDGENGWQLDQNGKVSALAGTNLRGEITAAYLSSWSHLLHGRMPGSAKYIGVEDSTGLQTIRFYPAGGDSVTFYLDGESFLPARSEQPAQERTLTLTYSDWRPVEGILFPGRFTQSTGDPQYDASGEIIEVTLNAEPPQGTFGKPKESANDFQFTEGESARDIPIELNTVHIFLQARVNGSDPLWFILDTGAALSVLNTATAADLGLKMAGKIEGRGAGEGSVEVNLVPDVSFDLPGVKLTGQTVATVPLSKIEERVGRPIDGILGYDFISRFVTEIDYENLKLSLFDKSSYQYSGDGAVVPMDIEDSTPRIEALVAPPGREPIECRLLVDTGANAAIDFARPFTEKNDLLSSLSKKFFYVGGAGIGGESKSYVGRIDNVEVGGLKFNSPICGFSMDEGGAGADPNNAGLLGGEILSRCTTTFDYEHGRIILEPNSKFGSPFEGDMGGISWTTGGRGDFHSFTVLRILPDSPAAAAGIEAGDRLVSVDGVPAAEFTVHKLWKYFRQDGREVGVIVQRNAEKISRTFHLRPLI